MTKSKSKIEVKDIENVETINMEEDMTKSKSEVEEVKSEATDIAALLKEALAVAQATPAKIKGTTQGGVRGGLSAMLLSLLNASDAPLAINQLTAGCHKLGRTQTTDKNVSDYVWGLWKRGLVNKGASIGIYQRLDIEGGVPYVKK